MDTKKLGGFRSHLKPFNLVILFVILAVFMVGAVLLIQGLGRKPVGSIAPGQIRIQKGEKVVIVNDDGFIEYKSPSGTFYETWDSAKVQQFFEFMRAKAREYLDNPPPEGVEGYYMTLYLDGEEVTVFIPEGDEELDEVFENFPDEGGEKSLSEYFETVFTEEEESSEVGGSPTPTPTPVIVSALEGETVSGGGGDGAGQVPFDCALYEQSVTQRTVISNTLCVVEPE